MYIPGSSLGNFFRDLRCFLEREELETDANGKVLPRGLKTSARRLIGDIGFGGFLNQLSPEKLKLIEAIYTCSNLQVEYESKSSAGGRQEDDESG
jgi:hypothetical protein